MAHFPVEPTAEAYRMTEFERAAADEGRPPAKSYETRRKLVEIFGKHRAYKNRTQRENRQKSQFIREDPATGRASAISRPRWSINWR